VMALKPGDKQLSIVKSAGENDLQQARSIRWEDEKLQLVIEKWAQPTPRLTMKIVPAPDSKPTSKTNR
jgi:hypothetical protein